MFGSAESEHTTLYYFGRISTYVIKIHQHYRRTDDMRSQNRAWHSSASRGKNVLNTFTSIIHVVFVVNCLKQHCSIQNIYQMRYLRSYSKCTENILVSQKVPVNLLTVVCIFVQEFR